MDLDSGTYESYCCARARKSPALRNCFRAFWTGGSVCLLAECFFRLYRFRGIPEETARILTPVTMIVLSAALTAAGIFDRIAKYAGAGTLVPITGFANAVVSPAIDHRSEGFISGVGAKMFIVAGPVIVWGTAASAVWGVIYWFLLTAGRG